MVSISPMNTDDIISKFGLTIIITKKLVVNTYLKTMLSIRTLQGVSKLPLFSILKHLR